MAVGFIMLCHQSLDRAAQVVLHLVQHGCPVVVHVDSRVSADQRAILDQKLGHLDRVRIISKQACEWGTFRIVQATQEAAELMLATFAEVDHVFMISGSCLPLRSIASLTEYLDQRPDTDFIESVTTEDVGWTIGGLNMERFTLRFPFSWRRQRWLFDKYVNIQRRLGVKRRIADGVIPHLGSQWWCLTRETLSAILSDPDRPRFDRYFRHVWIPDESYFQTLARRHTRRLESRSLTLSKFDVYGRPYVFYDDHLQLLRRSDCFFARKIWSGAHQLYQTFLTDEPAVGPQAEPNPGMIERLFVKTAERRLKGRTGLYMQSRFPDESRINARTAAPYAVMQGFDVLYQDFPEWMSRLTGTRVHGRLFAPHRAEFAGDENIFNGALSDSAALRDYNPKAFLANLIWNTRGERQIFQYAPQDKPAILPFIIGDPQAYLAVVSGAWAIPLASAAQEPDADFMALRREAAILQRHETAMLDLLAQPWAKARHRVWSLTEFLSQPHEFLQTLLDEINPGTARRLSERPKIQDLNKLPDFLQSLRNEGMQPVLVGDLKELEMLILRGGERRGRPRVAR